MHFNMQVEGVKLEPLRPEGESDGGFYGGGFFRCLFRQQILRIY